MYSPENCYQKKMSAHDLSKDVLEQLECPVCMEYMLPPITLCCTVQSTCSTCYHPSRYVVLSSLHALNATTHHIMLHCPVYMHYMLPPTTLCCTVQSTCTTCYHPSHYVALSSLHAVHATIHHIMLQRTQHL
jgi:hypothetical protein